MEFFDTAVNYLPVNWERKNYKSDTYFLIDLSETNDEFQEIKTYCATQSSNNVKEIKRIQHPFAYLRYKLRTEFQHQWGENVPLVNNYFVFIFLIYLYFIDTRNNESIYLSLL